MVLEVVLVVLEVFLVVLEVVLVVLDGVCGGVTSHLHTSQR